MTASAWRASASRAQELLLVPEHGCFLTARVSTRPRASCSTFAIEITREAAPAIRRDSLLWTSLSNARQTICQEINHSRPVAEHIGVEAYRLPRALDHDPIPKLDALDLRPWEKALRK